MAAFHFCEQLSGPRVVHAASPASNWTQLKELFCRMWIYNQIISGAQQQLVMIRACWWTNKQKTTSELWWLDRKEGVAAGGVNAQSLSRGATVACSGHVVGPVGSTRWSLGAFIGVGGWGDTTGSGSRFLLLWGHLRSLTGGWRADSCNLETPAGLHDGVYHYGNNKRTLL